MSLATEQGEEEEGEEEAEAAEIFVDMDKQLWLKLKLHFVSSGFEYPAHSGSRCCQSIPARALVLLRLSSPVLRRVCQAPVPLTLLTRRAERCSASTRHATETRILRIVSEGSAAERARRPSRLGPPRSHPTMDHSARRVPLVKA